MPNIIVATLKNLATLKPSAHRTIFVTGNRDLVFCHQRRKRISSIFDIEDCRQRQKSFISNMFSSLTTEDKTSVASDKNRAVCARLNAGFQCSTPYLHETEGAVKLRNYYRTVGNKFRSKELQR